MRSPRVEAAFRQLVLLVQALGPGKRLPTIRELRDRYGFSISTLDAALDELQREGRIDRRRGSGVYVLERNQRERMAMLFNPAFFYELGSSPFWSLLIREAERQTRESGASFHLCFVDPQLAAEVESEWSSPSGIPPALQEDFMRKRIAWSISVGVGHPLTRWVEAQGVPLVSFAGPSQYIIQVASSRLLTEAFGLIHQSGARRVLVLGGAADTVPEHPDLDLQFALDMREESSKSPVTQGFAAATSWPLSELPEAIVSIDDLLTSGFLLGLERRGVPIGKDVDVYTLSVEGSPILLGWEDRITRFEVSIQSFAQTMIDAARRLSRATDGATDEAAALAGSDWDDAELTPNGEQLLSVPFHLLTPRTKRID